MGLPNKDEVKGKFKQVKGTVREKTGRAVGNPDLEEQGAAEHASGKAQQKLGKVRRKVGDAIKEVGEKVRR